MLYMEWMDDAYIMGCWVCTVERCMPPFRVRLCIVASLQVKLSVES